MLTTTILSGFVGAAIVSLAVWIYFSRVVWELVRIASSLAYFSPFTVFFVTDWFKSMVFGPTSGLIVAWLFLDIYAYIGPMGPQSPRTHGGVPKFAGVRFPTILKYIV